jgi:hypothetical protein
MRFTTWHLVMRYSNNFQINAPSSIGLSRTKDAFNQKTWYAFIAIEAARKS